jgi:transcriptional regulator with XRE-family HTH domain
MDLASHPFVAGWSTLEGRPARKDARLEFLKWLHADDPDRETQSQLAARIGVSEAAISQWKQHPLVVEDSNLARLRQIEGHMPSVIENMATLAKSDRNKAAAVQAARTLATLARQYIEAEAKPLDVSKLTDQELRELMVDALDELDERAPMSDAV